MTDRTKAYFLKLAELLKITNKQTIAYYVHSLLINKRLMEHEDPEVKLCLNEKISYTYLIS